MLQVALKLGEFLTKNLRKLRFLTLAANLFSAAVSTPKRLHSIRFAGGRSEISSYRFSLSPLVSISMCTETDTPHWTAYLFDIEFSQRPTIGPPFKICQIVVLQRLCEVHKTRKLLVFRYTRTSTRVMHFQPLINNSFVPVRPISTMELIDRTLK